MPSKADRGHSKLWPSGMQWTKWEIRICILTLVAYHTYMIYRLVDVSLSHSHEIDGLVASNWKSNWHFDDADLQWRTFRTQILLLFLAAIVHLVLSQGLSDCFSCCYRKVAERCRQDSEPCSQAVELKSIDRESSITTDEDEAVNNAHFRSSSYPRSTSIVDSNSTQSSSQSSTSHSPLPLSHSSSSDVVNHRNLGVNLRVSNSRQSDKSATLTDDDCSTESQAKLEDRIVNDGRSDGKYLVHIIVGVCLMVAVHQAGAIWSLTLTIVNFIIITKLVALSSTSKTDSWKNRIFSPVSYTWTSCIGILLLNAYWDGYKFAYISESLRFLDGYKGFYKWQRPFNFVTLKMISFNLDYLWATQGNDKGKEKGNGKREQDSGPPPEDANKMVVQETMDEQSETNDDDETKSCSIDGFCRAASLSHADLSNYVKRQESHQFLSQYYFMPYIAYVVYPPLYLAGPICSFNAWNSQIMKPQKIYDFQALIIYGVHWMMNFIIFEVFIHTIYVTAIMTVPANEHLWNSFSIAMVGISSYVAFFHIWAKLYLTWRFFRLWSLIDGIDVPENMTRFVYHIGYSTMVFWKHWHRSFNQWILRYLYIPLGGSRVNLLRRVLNIILIFTYVALWHGICVKLLLWSLFILMSFIPELFLRSFINRKRFGRFRSTVAFRYLCVVGGAANICGLLVANVVGFVVGFDWLKRILIETRPMKLLELAIHWSIFCYALSTISIWLDTQNDGVERDSVRVSVPITDEET